MVQYHEGDLHDYRHIHDQEEVGEVDYEINEQVQVVCGERSSHPFENELNC